MSDKGDATAARIRRRRRGGTIRSFRAMRAFTASAFVSVSRFSSGPEPECRTSLVIVMWRCAKRRACPRRCRNAPCIATLNGIDATGIGDAASCIAERTIFASLNEQPASVHPRCRSLARNTRATKRDFCFQLSGSATHIHRPRAVGFRPSQRAANEIGSRSPSPGNCVAFHHGIGVHGSRPWFANRLYPSAREYPDPVRSRQISLANGGSALHSPWPCAWDRR